MPEYRVTWEINVETDTPLEAARRARGYQTKPDTTATVFEVTELDAHHQPVSSVEVDLGGPGEPGHVDGEPLPDRYCNHDLSARTPLPLSDYDRCECGLLFYDGEVVVKGDLGGYGQPPAVDGRPLPSLATAEEALNAMDRLAGRATS